MEHGGRGILEAGIVGARHGMPAQIGEAVFLRQRETGVADQPLCAAAVDDHRLRADMRAVLPQIVHSGGGIDGDQDQIAGGKGIFRQGTVHSAGKNGKVGNGLIRVKGQDSMACLVVGLGKRAADQS